MRSERAEPTPPPPLLLVYGRDIGSTWANLFVWRDGAPVHDARVVVNGAVLTRSGLEAGYYSGPLPAQVSPGEPISLEVTSGDLSVTGTGALPDRPLVTAAYTSAAVASDGDIVVTWTSPSDPDDFKVVVRWSCGPVCGAGTDFLAAGSDRTLTIPAGLLPPGLDVDVAVFAYDDGSLAGDYLPYAPYPGMNIRAESERLAVATGVSGPPPATLQVYGRDIGDAAANVSVMRDGQGIDDAVVVVNGTVLPHRNGEDGAYSAYLETPLSAGDPVSLEVTHGGLRVTGLDSLPEKPLLTSPQDGAAFTSAQDVVVTWTTPTDPGLFEVVANWTCGPGCGTGKGFEAAGSARTLTIPAASLPSPAAIELAVFAYDDGTFTGDYSPWLPYPGMNIRAESNRVLVHR